jgi:hypothetical protein
MWVVRRSLPDRVSAIASPGGDSGNLVLAEARTGRSVSNAPA